MFHQGEVSSVEESMVVKARMGVHGFRLVQREVARMGVLEVWENPKFPNRRLATIRNRRYKSKCWVHKSYEIRKCGT